MRILSTAKIQPDHWSYDVIAWMTKRQWCCTCRKALGKIHGRGLPNCYVIFPNSSFERQREQTTVKVWFSLCPSTPTRPCVAYFVNNTKWAQVAIMTTKPRLRKCLFSTEGFTIVTTKNLLFLFQLTSYVWHRILVPDWLKERCVNQWSRNLMR